MIRTEGLPFRVMTNTTTTNMVSPIFTGAATSASTPLPPLHPSAGFPFGNGGGGMYGTGPNNLLRGMVDRSGTAVGGGTIHQQDAAARALQMQLQGAFACSPFKSAFNLSALPPVSVATSFAAAVPPGPATGLFPHPLFTPAQWQELQRQALIYKHLVSSAPVPSDLLLGTRSVIHPNAPGGGFLNLRLSGGALDPEPGRCRRTDGKKWRCSRDAAPDQRYCERHLHRGRPRSRKPVERGQNKNAAAPASAAAVVDGNRNNNANTSDLPGGAAANNGFIGFPLKSSSMLQQVSSPYGVAAGVPKSDLPFLSMPPPEKEPKYLDWIKDSGISEIQQHHTAADNGSTPVHIAGFRTTSSPTLQGFPDYRQFNSAAMSDLNSSPSHYPFINLEPQAPPARRFIDAWSAEGHNAGASTSNRDMANNHQFAQGHTTAAGSSEQLSPSSLTLSMSGGGSGRSCGSDYAPDHFQMGLAVNELSSSTKSQAMFGPFGGPLAEVLQSGSSTGNGGFVGTPAAPSYTGLMNLMSRSSCCSGNEGVSPRGDRGPTRVLSSPTGVLQTALVSLSDSSSNSSPRFGTGCGGGGARPEVGLQWMNQNNMWW